MPLENIETNDQFEGNRRQIAEDLDSLLGKVLQHGGKTNLKTEGRIIRGWSQLRVFVEEAASHPEKNMCLPCDYNYSSLWYKLAYLVIKKITKQKTF